MKKKSNIIFLKNYLKKDPGQGESLQDFHRGSSGESPAKTAPEFVDVHLRDTQKRTPLHIAAKKGNKEEVWKLIKAGAEANVIDRDGNTPLHFVSGIIGNGPADSAKAIHEETAVQIAEMLIEEGKAEVNLGNKDIETPLHIAARCGNSQLFRMLIEKGAQIGIKTKKEKTPKDYAQEVNCPEIVKILEEAEAGSRIVFMEDYRKKKGAPAEEKVFSDPFDSGDSALGEKKFWKKSVEKPIEKTGKVIYMEEYLNRKRPPEWIPFPGDVPGDLSENQDFPARRGWGLRASAAAAAMFAAVLTFSVLPWVDSTGVDSTGVDSTGAKSAKMLGSDQPGIQKTESRRGIAGIKGKNKLDNKEKMLLITGRHANEEEDELFERAARREPQSLNLSKNKISASEYIELISKNKMLHAERQPAAPLNPEGENGLTR